jgi:hypothetical protein
LLVGFVGSYLLGSIGYAVIGPLAQVVGPGRMLAFAAAYAAASSSAARADAGAPPDDLAG